MRMELEVTPQKIVLALVFLSVGATVGYVGAAAQQQLIETVEQPICPTAISLTEADLNIMADLAVLGGHCERLGLVSTIFVEDFNGTPYGVPICVEAT